MNTNEQQYRKMFGPRAALAAICIAAPLAIGTAFAQDPYTEPRAGDSAETGGEEAAALPALYTEDQAVRGQRTFAQACGGCHGEDLVEALGTYSSALNFFDFSRSSMPADSPGSVADQSHVDIIAHLMRQIGFPAGDEELTTDRDVLGSIDPRLAVGGE